MPFHELTKAMQMMPQMKRILKHLISRGSISPMEALNTHRVYRLSSIINRLRKAGYNITTDMRQDEAGQKYARYFLAA